MRQGHASGKHPEMKMSNGKWQLLYSLRFLLFSSCPCISCFADFLRGFLWPVKRQMFRFFPFLVSFLPLLAYVVQPRCVPKTIFSWFVMVRVVQDFLCQCAP